MDMTRDGTWEDHRARGVDTVQWLVSRLLHGESLLALVRELATSLRASMLRPSSPSPSAEIHVSPMSLQWLRTFEDDYDKHGAAP
jgi:hypothetical protein